MLEFEPFSLAALQKALPYIRQEKTHCSDLTAGWLYLWHVGADLHFCIRRDTLVIRQTVGGQPAFCWPIGRDPDGMIDELLSYTRDKGTPLRFFAVDEETLEKIRRDPRLDPVTWAYDARWSDYLYDFEEAATFKGKKFSGQRNHVNRFKRLYGEPVIRPLRPEDRPALDAMLAEYEAEHPEQGAMERQELAQTKKLLDIYEQLELPAACLTVEGEIAAFSIGEIVGDMLLIHVEKALRRFEGVYPTMYSGFVRLIAQQRGEPLRYVNREDDGGDSGLRVSKQQYHPVAMVHKLFVHANDPVGEARPASGPRCERRTEKRAVCGPSGR